MSLVSLQPGRAAAILTRPHLWALRALCLLSSDMLDSSILKEILIKCILLILCQEAQKNQLPVYPPSFCRDCPSSPQRPT